jgi:hypothetical protein
MAPNIWNEVRELGSSQLPKLCPKIPRTAQEPASFVQSCCIEQVRWGSNSTFEGEIDFVIFFSDPLEPQPHDPDVKALFRIAVVWNIPVACNRASADFLISSPLMSTEYERVVPDYSKYRARLAGRGVEGDEYAGLGVMGPEISRTRRNILPLPHN